MCRDSFRATAALATALVLAGPAVEAGTDPPPPPLPLAAAVRAALAGHPDLAAAEAAVEAARQRPAVEREWMPPMLEVGAWEWPRNRWQPRDVQWMVTLTQELPGRGKRDLRAARAAAEAGLMAGEVAVRGREIAREVAETYVDLRVAREEIALLAVATTAIADAVAAAEARYAAGLGSQQEALAGIVELARLQQEELMGHERARMAASRLNLLLGRHVDAPIGPLDATADDVPVPALADIEARLIGLHPELVTVERRQQLADADLALARREASPDFVLRGGYMTMPSMADAFTASVGITWPASPWTRRRAAALTRVAEAERAAADARRETVVLRLRTMAQEAIVAARGAADRARLLQVSLVPRAEHALEVARTAYASGRADLAAVLEAQRTLVDARLQVRRALGARDRALAALRVLIGEFDVRPDAEDRS